MHAPRTSSIQHGPADALGLEQDPLVLDLGREWHELAHYPMVWALYVCARGAATPATVAEIRALAREAERVASTWEDRTSPAVHQFFARDLQLRLDDVALASLTQIGEYLYYYEQTRELNPLKVYDPPAMDPGEDTPGWAKDAGLN